MTARKPVPAPAGAAHETLIVPDSAYMVKIPNRQANLRRPEDYPVTAICQVCHHVVRRESMESELLDWVHTDRKAGE